MDSGNSASYFHNKEEIVELTAIEIDDKNAMGQIARGIPCLPFHKGLWVLSPFRLRNAFKSYTYIVDHRSSIPLHHSLFFFHSVQ